jgi:hypothetical protein
VSPDDVAAQLPGARVLQAGGGHGRGNLLLLFEDAAEPAVLKVYRPRRPPRRALREALRSFSHRAFEGKRGTGPRQRRRTEEQSLRLWRRLGFDVPGLPERPLPDALREPALWLEYCPGPTLATTLRDPAVGPARRGDLVARLASQQGVRHAAALERAEPLLLQEHASLKHVLVCGERLVTFDFEIGFARSLPVLGALAQELAGTLRSLERGRRGRELYDVYVEAHPHPELLVEAARRALHGGGIAGLSRRWSDRRRRGPSKGEVLGRLLSR